MRQVLNDRSQSGGTVGRCGGLRVVRTLRTKELRGWIVGDCPRRRVVGSGSYLVERAGAEWAMTNAASGRYVDRVDALDDLFQQFVRMSNHAAERLHGTILNFKASVQFVFEVFPREERVFSLLRVFQAD